MRFRVALLFSLIAVCSSSANADDVGASARGVVRVIVAAEDSVDSTNSSVAFGSGFAISAHRIVTNAHVVQAAENPFAESIVAIVPSEGSRALTGTITAFDPSRDLAVVDVGAARLEPLAIYAGPVDSGMHAVALGYPGNVDLATVRSMYDLITPTSPVRSEGNVSSSRNVNGLAALLHTAAIARGNSGGPLVDSCGRVLGVNTYTTQSGAGDAPFGFAIVSQALMSFLRDQGEKFQQIGSPCVTAAEQAAQEERAHDEAAMAAANAETRAAARQQEQSDTVKAAIQDSRDNHAVGAGLLALGAVIAGVVATILFVRDRLKIGAAASVIAVGALAGAAYAFFSRPSFDVAKPAVPEVTSASIKPATGNLLCQVKPELSRITVSSLDDLAINWSSSGCMNGRTQYLHTGQTWRRILVPNGTETVFVQDFDPLKGEYISQRYLLPQDDMVRLREMRGDIESNSCGDLAAVSTLQNITSKLVQSLPQRPNERIVYHCSTEPSRN